MILCGRGIVKAKTHWRRDGITSPILSSSGYPRPRASGFVFFCIEIAYIQDLSLNLLCYPKASEKVVGKGLEAGVSCKADESMQSNPAHGLRPHHRLLRSLAAPALLEARMWFRDRF
jgi:hypothetical protein